MCRSCVSINSACMKYLETFKEAIKLEKRYTKHRNSRSFHEYQERQKLKRKHPVNYDQSQLDLIDVKDMVKKINGKAGIILQNISSFSPMNWKSLDEFELFYQL